MSRGRIDRLVTSAVVVFLVSGAASGAYAWREAPTDGLVVVAAADGSGVTAPATSSGGDEVPSPAVVAPATTEAPAVTPQPAAATKADEVPTPAVAAPPAATRTPAAAAPPAATPAPT